MTYLLNRMYLEQMNGTASAVAIEVYIIPKKRSDEMLLTYFYVCMYVCMYSMYILCMYVCIYVCMYSMYICMYVCIYAYE